MTLPNGLTWEIARAGGFTAYLLLSASVTLGLVLSLQWRSTNWPRFVTNETHRFLALLTLVFIGVHTLAVAPDPFIGMTPLELLVPALSHYRPLWVALGIVGAYLVIAIWASEYLRPHVGFRWWRRLHYLTFVGFVLAAIHGVGTGSDTRTLWGELIYGLSIALVLGLLLIRLLLPAASGRRHPRVAGAAALAIMVAVMLAAAGPFQPGWNAIANNGAGSGARGSFAAATDAATLAPGAAQTPPSPPIAPFQAAFTGTLQQGSMGADGTGDRRGRRPDERRHGRDAAAQS